MSFRQYRDFEHDEQVVVAVDTSAGGLDYTCAQFLSRKHFDIPLVYHSKKTATEFTNVLPKALNKIYDETGIRPLVAYERNNGGAFEMDRIAAMNRDGKYDIFKMPTFGQVDNPDSVRLGWDTNTASRPKMLSELKEAIDKKVITIYDKPTINELFSFIVVQTSSSWKAQAEVGAHDDTVMALAIAWQLHQMSPASEIAKEVPLQDFKDWAI